MHSWNDKLRNATQTLLHAVTEVHNKTPDSVMVRLVTSISDIIQLVEQLNADHKCLQNELRREKESSENVLARVRKLEKGYRQIERAVMIREVQGSEDFDSGVGGVGEVPLEDGFPGEVDKSFEQVERMGLIRETQTIEERCENSGDGDAENAPREVSPGVKEMKNKQVEDNGEPPRTPPSTPRPTSPAPQEASISPYKPLIPKDLPPLPTLHEVEAEQRERRSQKRALASQKFPPCEKCCVRKKALMIGEHGYVKEDVFMRWSKRPGGCIAYMHYDEPLPEGVGSELSFKDTETQAPSEFLVGGNISKKEFSLML